MKLTIVLIASIGGAAAQVGSFFSSWSSSSSSSSSSSKSSTALKSNTTGSYLTATAIVTNAQNNSAFQCWRFKNPLEPLSTSGALRFGFNLSNAAAAEYVVIPPRFDGGVQLAPRPFLGIYASGLAHITLPFSDDEAWILGGKNGLLIVADPIGTGHHTTYPTDETTVTFALPILNDELPAYEVLSKGPCFYHGTQVVGGG
ncbi:uncharacterized protein K452DRAFT_239817 [Aplosporella prunicola CBS 121167]|uniref:Uncharacterized protein n=1 Tax=Aplosporella prunicola CBS 121167 TaxID=1176127 RepID=A0A6A6AVF5_9PEZI|nr:uncharacterized protein K452DRAFT_239817 [Aplosporella prunicola CBS 121167]KAF2135198.1 hypothetical protein K452DRAFT_239817 [Aplosporella prunicola CBS 121167]